MNSVINGAGILLLGILAGIVIYSLSKAIWKALCERKLSAPADPPDPHVELLRAILLRIDERSEPEALKRISGQLSLIAGRLEVTDKALALIESNESRIAMVLEKMSALTRPATTEDLAKAVTETLVSLADIRDCLNHPTSPVVLELAEQRHAMMLSRLDAQTDAFEDFTKYFKQWAQSMFGAAPGYDVMDDAEAVIREKAEKLQKRYGLNHAQAMEQARASQVYEPNNGMRERV